MNERPPTPISALDDRFSIHNRNVCGDELYSRNYARVFRACRLPFQEPPKLTPDLGVASRYRTTRVYQHRIFSQAVEESVDVSSSPRGVICSFDGADRSLIGIAIMRNPRQLRHRWACTTGRYQRQPSAAAESRSDAGV